MAEIKLPAKEENGVVMVLGTLPRTPDPAEDKYRRAKVSPPPSAANLNEPVLLPDQSFDPRPPIFNQGNMGSCAACSTCMAVFAMRNLARHKMGQTPDAKLFNPAPVYYEARRKHGWQMEDSGSFVADNMDLLLQDGPLLTGAKPYIDDPLKAWDQTAWDDGAAYDYEKSHQPFYENMVEFMWLAFKEGLPVVLSSYWPDAWFRPVGGKIPAGIPFNPRQGAHAFYAWGYVPGFILCDNTWSAAWSRDAATFGYQMRPGSFALPVSYFVKGGPVFEARVVSPEPILAPQPEPEPQPQPEDLRKRLEQAAMKVKQGFLDIAKDRNHTGYVRQLARNNAAGAQAVIDAQAKIK